MREWLVESRSGVALAILYLSVGACVPSADEQGAQLAAKIRVHADLGCITRWADATAASRVHSMPAGGTDVELDQWPPCVRDIVLDDEGHALHPLRVVLPEDGGAVILILIHPNWLLHVGGRSTASRRWPVNERLFLTIDEG